LKTNSAETEQEKGKMFNLRTSKIFGGLDAEIEKREAEATSQFMQLIKCTEIHQNENDSFLENHQHIDNLYENNFLN
jgi:hypothetical protein